MNITHGLLSGALGTVWDAAFDLPFDSRNACDLNLHRSLICLISSSLIYLRAQSPVQWEVWFNHCMHLGEVMLGGHRIIVYLARSTYVELTLMHEVRIHVQLIMSSLYGYQRPTGSVDIDIQACTGVSHHNHNS